MLEGGLVAALSCKSNTTEFTEVLLHENHSLRHLRIHPQPDRRRPGADRSSSGPRHRSLPGSMERSQRELVASRRCPNPFLLGLSPAAERISGVDHLTREIRRTSVEHTRHAALECRQDLSA